MSVRHTRNPVAGKPTIGMEGGSGDANLLPECGLTFDPVTGNLQILGPAGNVMGTVSDTGLSLSDGTGSTLNRRSGGVVASAAGVAVHDSSTETVSAKLTLPAGTIVVGTIIKIRGRVRATATVSTDTLTPKLYLGGTGGTALISGAATDVANNDTSWFEFTLMGTAAAGAAAAVVGFGTFVELAGTTVKSAKLDTTNFATNGALDIALSLKWSTTNANSALVEWWEVEIYG